MAWLSALFKALLEWLSSEVKKDTKASDADATPQDLKDKWRRRIEEQEAKSKAEKKIVHIEKDEPKKVAPEKDVPNKKPPLNYWQRQLRAEVRKRENEEDSNSNSD